jgi:peptide/nickel transport system ATP-binding protein/oligopeptide transport system ATP-binding protein
LSVVSHIADETIVMVLGTVVECGATAALFEHPVHPYTQALLSAIPLADPIAQRSRPKIILSGDPPSPLASQPGCAFVSRCPIREDRCATVRPTLNATITGTAAACLVRAP